MKKALENIESLIVFLGVSNNVDGLNIIKLEKVHLQEAMKDFDINKKDVYKKIIRKHKTFTNFWQTFETVNYEVIDENDKELVFLEV